MPDSSHCAECGDLLPPTWPKGLCSRCALQGALGLSNAESQALQPESPQGLARAIVMPETDSALDRTGAMIGRYKLLQKIGEGGFGVVYMAEQQEPVQRKVALKIIKAGMDTREVIARFEAERQAIALMDHPNIARVLDAGATEAGRPYFVMELIRGLPITDFCDQGQLSAADRLKLFMTVCHAVQHAHQKGVIHRDLKPSNVLVTLHDGKPVPKVIDFGVAKALGQKLTAKTLFTAFHHLIGTPAYMSPEQAALSGLDIDTRADIYSLGVLLYELLTGVTPFDTEMLRKAALDEIRRMIREVEPPKPSTRLTQELAAASARDSAQRRKGEKEKRGVEPPTRLEPSSLLFPAAPFPPRQHAHSLSASPRQLQEKRELIRQLRGDLDWIVMKCLEKDRARRYETANGLAVDIQRHLHNETVVARPPSNLYRFQKMVRRNKLAFAAVSAVLTALIVGFCISLWMFIKEREALHRAVAAENRTTLESLKFHWVARQTGWIDATRQHLAAMARIPRARGTNLALFDPFFVTFKTYYTNYDDSGLIESNGLLIGSSFGHKSLTNLADRADFRRVLETQDFAIGNYQAGDETRKPSLPFGYPVFDEKGRAVVRVVYAALDLAVLSNAAAQAQLPKGGEIVILDRRGHILARCPEPGEWIGKSFCESNIVATMIADGEGWVEIRGVDGVLRWYTFVSIGGRNGVDLLVMIGSPTSAVFVDAKKR